MQNSLLRLAVVFCAIFSGDIWGAPELDARYAFQMVLATVVGADSQNLHAQTVQTEMEQFFKQRPRFTLISVAEKPPMATLSRTQSEALSPWEGPLKAAGGDSLVLAQVQKKGAEFQIILLGAVIDPPEIIFETVVTVQDGYSLKSFGAAVVDGLSALVRALPFDATIVSREGYRVVIDRGAPSFKSGTRLPVFTLERKSRGVDLKESGLIQLNRVEKNLSFATILVENKPLEILKGNKVRFQPVSGLEEEGNQRAVSLRPPVLSRDIASVPSLTIGEPRIENKEKWANLEVQLAATMMSWDRTASGSTTPHSDSGFYPGAHLRGDIKLTKDAFMEIDGVFGSSNLQSTAGGTSVGLSSQFTQLRLQAGYRFRLAEQGPGPRFFVRGGFSRTQYSVAEIPAVVGPTSAAFSGLILGGGLVFPFSERIEFGLDMNALFFPSLTESGGTSGAVTSGVSGWDFAVRGIYRWNEKMNLEGRLVFQTHSANFSGTGSRPVPFDSLNQTSRAFMAGINYAF